MKLRFYLTLSKITLIKFSQRYFVLDYFDVIDVFMLLVIKHVKAYQGHNIGDIRVIVLEAYQFALSVYSLIFY